MPPSSASPLSLSGCRSVAAVTPAQAGKGGGDCNSLRGSAVNPREDELQKIVVEALDCGSAHML